MRREIIVDFLSALYYVLYVQFRISVCFVKVKILLTTFDCVALLAPFSKSARPFAVGESLLHAAPFSTEARRNSDLLGKHDLLRKVREDFGRFKKSFQRISFHHLHLDLISQDRDVAT
jgi:hypothetical protein